MLSITARKTIFIYGLTALLLISMDGANAGWFSKFKGAVVRAGSPSTLTKVEKKLVKGGRSVNFGGIKVVQVDKKIAVNEKDGKGRTNCDRMRSGLAPLGPDNIEIELHHVQQNPAGPILELTHTEHKQNDKKLHDKKMASKIDRGGSFRRWRRSYWMQRSLGLCKF